MPSKVREKGKNKWKNYFTKFIQQSAVTTDRRAGEVIAAQKVRSGRRAIEREAILYIAHVPAKETWWCELPSGTHISHRLAASENKYIFLLFFNENKLLALFLGVLLIKNKLQI